MVGSFVKLWLCLMGYWRLACFPVPGCLVGYVDLVFSPFLAKSLLSLP